MIISRNQFFLLLFIIFIGPFIFYNIMWIATSMQTTGIMQFKGHTLELQGISSHPVIRFKAGNDTIYFNGKNNLNLLPGEIVPVRYKSNDPSDAKVNTFFCIWVDTILYSLPFFLVLLILFLTPDRFDPLIPKKSHVLLGKKSFITIIPISVMSNMK